MKLLLDENISDRLKELFASSGFDILDLKEKKLRQLPDKQIIEIAAKEKRIIVTHDRDFLTFMNDPNCRAKILLISINPQTEERMEAVGRFLISLGILNKLRRSGVVTYWTNEISFSLN